MTFKKGFVIFMLSLTLIFSFASVASAAPSTATTFDGFIKYLKAENPSYVSRISSYYVVTESADKKYSYIVFSTSPITINPDTKKGSTTGDGALCNFGLNADGFYVYSMLSAFDGPNNQLPLIGSYTFGSIIASNHDIKVTGSDTVFFERPPVPYPILAGEVLGEKLTPTIQMLVPVGLAILSALLAIYLIPRLIRSFL